MRALAFLIASIFLMPYRAIAEPGAVIISGKVTDRDRAVARGAAERSVAAAGWVLDGKPFATKDVNAITACLHDVAAWPCVSKIVNGRGIRRVAVVSLNRDPAANGSPQVAITERLVLSDAELVALGQRFCERCTDDTLDNLTAELTNELLQHAALESGRTVLAVRSTPQGAIYSVDGVVGGATDATINIVPGTHVVTIDHEGFERATRTIEAVEGKTAEVTVTLQRTDQVGAQHPPAVGSHKRDTVAPRSRALPIALVIVGAVAIGGGATALAFNGSDVVKPPNEPQPRGYYDTVPAGVTALVGGVVVAGVGGYLWWKYSHDRPSSTPTVTPVAGGAVLGVLGAF